MADDRSEPGAGDVAFELAGKPVVLKPTLDACIALSRNGLARTRERCEALDFDTIVEVIAVGMGVNPGQKARLVAPAVYETGMIKLAAPCIMFLHAIANGGAIPQVSATGAALDALNELISWVSGHEPLSDQLEPLAALRARMVEIYEVESAEADETTDPLPESGSPSENSIDA